MTLPSLDTLVTYPDGATVSTGTIVHVEPLAGGRSAVLLDRTALHPVDTAWPDQPADRGVLRVGDVDHPLLDGLTGGIHDGILHVGDDLPVRGGTEGWTFVVAHVIDGTPPAVGVAATVTVDAGHRRALSAGHTGCHLASLALDAALRDAWSKPAPVDALGSPAFDQLAIQTSRIVPGGSVDTYRIGKSLRRKGFDPSVLDDLPAITARIDSRLSAWAAGRGEVRIERSSDELSARRTWVCALPEATVSIPCGGTHLASLAEIATVRVDLLTRPVDGGLELVMTTHVALA